MPQNPPEGFPRITPYLLYEDVDAAVDWLVGTCGFTERMRMKGPDGKANHAEVALGDGVVMTGSPGPDYQNPKRRGGATQLNYVLRSVVSIPAGIAEMPLPRFLLLTTLGSGLWNAALIGAGMGARQRVPACRRYRRERLDRGHCDHGGRACRDCCGPVGKAARR